MNDGTCVECGRFLRIRCRGMCKRCYGRLQWHGALDRHPRTRMTPDDWFALIDTSDPDACWPWPGPQRRRTGYGNASGTSAHIYVWRRAVGPIPADLTISHTCHDLDLSCRGGITCLHRMCVNYERHLELATFQVNLFASSRTAATINTNKTHCIHGHPLSGSNLRYNAGKRVCQTCNRAAVARYDRRRRQR